MQIARILKEKKLNITASRKLILNILLESKVALSEKEIRSQLGDHCDRATIYRTLKTYAGAGIVHPVIMESLTTKYVIKKEPENHLHFKCTSCDRVFCLTAVKISSYTLPRGFIQNETNFLVTGVCKSCNK